MAIAAKILVIEDDLHIRRLVRAAVERVGNRAVEAASAREGLTLVDIEKPDLVLLDLGLPDRDGLELIQLVRARAAVPILVIS
ncbi:response regulator, partial [Acinetobacter baumannii]